MSEVFANVEEITRARAEIEDAEWGGPVEPKVLGPFNIDINPINDVFEAINLWGPRSIRKFVAQILKFQPINLIQEALFVDGMGQPAEMFRRAGDGVARKQLSKLS